MTSSTPHTTQMARRNPRRHHLTMKHDPTKIDTILTPEVSLRAYTLGLFPMARSRADSQIFWLDPDKRGIIMPKSFHTPKKLKKTLRKNLYTVSYNQQFQNVINACAKETPKRQDTWLNNGDYQPACSTA